MDNIILEKIWQDSSLLELKVSSNSEFVSIYQNCYIEDKIVYNYSEQILKYVENYAEQCYLEFGNKSGNYTPAFSICILPANTAGHVKIEVDMEIADNDSRTHRCSFYVESELGLIENFGKKLMSLASGPEGTKVSLNSIY